MHLRNLPLCWECKKSDSVGFSIIADRETKRFVPCFNKHIHRRTCSAVADCIISEPTPHTRQPLPAPARPHAPVPGADAKEPSSGQRAAHAPTLHPVPQLLTTGAWGGTARCHSFSVAAVVMMMRRMRMSVRFVIRRRLSSRRQDQPQTQIVSLEDLNMYIVDFFFSFCACHSFPSLGCLCQPTKMAAFFFFLSPRGCVCVCLIARAGPMIHIICSWFT